MIDAIGERYVQRSWFERQFVRSDGELRFLDGPFRPVRLVPEAQRDEYIDLAMSHAAAAAGWLTVVLFPLGVVLAVLLLSPRLLPIGILFDVFVGYAVLRFVPEVRLKRQRVRALVDRWPIAEAPSAIRYFQRFWSADSFARISAHERRVLFWSGLFFAAGGGLMIGAGAGTIGWPSLALGILSWIVAGLARRAA